MEFRIPNQEEGPTASLEFARDARRGPVRFIHRPAGDRQLPAAPCARFRRLRACGAGSPGSYCSPSAWGRVNAESSLPIVFGLRAGNLEADECKPGASEAGGWGGELEELHRHQGHIVGKRVSGKGLDLFEHLPDEPVAAQVTQACNQLFQPFVAK